MKIITMGSIITVFSHKGGVGKTTLVHNLGYILADRGKRVLLIDADPQMNLTSAVAGFTDSVTYGEDGSEPWLEFLSTYPNLSSFLNDAAQRIQPKDPFFSTTKIYQYRDKHNANKAIGRATIKSGDILAFNGGSIDLIASSLGFSYSGGSGNPTSLPQLEFYLCNLAMNSGNPLTRGIIFDIHRALRKLTNTYDYILVDTPPNGGSILNGILFFSSDYFIIPVKPDFYSLQAVDGLSDIILNWKTYLQPWFRTQNQAGLHYPDFLGVAPQMTKRYDIQGSKYAAHAKLWDDLINTRVQNFLQNYVGFTHHNNMARAEQWFKGIYPDSTPYIIKECCHFTGKLRDVAERAAIPVVFLNNAICDEYTNDLFVETTKSDEQNQWYLAYQSIKREYNCIADGILKL